MGSSEVLVNGCGEEYTIDEVSGEEIDVDRKDKDDSLMEESEMDVISSDENEINCGDKDDSF